MLSFNNSHIHCLGSSFKCYVKTNDPTCFINCTYKSLQQSPTMVEIAIKLFILFIIFLGAIIGNSIMLIVVIRTKNLHTTTNYLLVNLAIGDLLVCFFNIWPFGMYHLKLNLYSLWTSSLVGFLAVISSTMTLTVIAYDRFIGIIFTLKSRANPRRATLYMTIIWITSITLSLPILIFTTSESRHWANQIERWCDYNFHHSGSPRRSKQILYLVLTAVFYFLPAAVMTAAYICIIRKLWRNSLPFEITKECIQRRKMATIMLVLILIVFYLCWSPVQIVNLIDVFRWKVKKSQIHHNVIYVTNTVAFSNALLYPLLYGGYNRKFKNAFNEIFPCKLFHRKRRRLTNLMKKSNMEHPRTLGTEISMTPLTKPVSSNNLS